jgi:GNAT superfamily N-acetyltransferase
LEVEALLARIETEFAGYQHRTWGIDALTAPQTAARLALEQGYRANDALVHVLEGDLKATVRLGRAASPNFEVREVLTKEDWQAYRELDAMWWKETSTGVFGPYDPALHEEFMVYRRLKEPQARAWFACVEDTPRAFFSSWPGENGVGIVEDLYCHPDYRHRGLATALIARAVADCRERGAGPVIINSDVNDTPKLMYAAMGFRPTFVHRTYTKRLDAKKNAPA